MAGILGVTPQTVNNWKANRTDIWLTYLISICNYFNCSLDYVAGLTERNTKPNNTKIKNFGSRIREIMKSRDISSYTLRKNTHYGSKYFYDWDRGADPKLSTLIELANYFNCTLDELVGFE